MGVWIILGLGLVVGAGLGWVALFRTLSAAREIAALKVEVASLRSVVDRYRPQAPSQSESVAAKPAEPLRAAPRDDVAAATPKPEATAPPLVRPADEVPVPPPTRAKKKPGGIEQSLAGNWLVWLGGAALVIGGAFLVKSAIDAGFFGPPMQVASGMLAGAAMIFAGERLRRAVVAGKAPAGIAPAVLAGAGGSTIFGAIYAAYGVYALIPSLAALLFLALACGGLIVLAVLHRAAPVAGLGLVGAFVAPILTASGDPAPQTLFVYVFCVAAGGLAVARIMSWRGVSYAALAGGALWPFVWIIGGSSAEGAAALAIYLPAFLAMSAFIAEDEASGAIDPGALLKGGLRAFPVGLAASHLAAAVALAIAFLFALKEDLSAATVGLGVGLALVATFAAWRREGFALLPIMAMLTIVAALAFAPSGAVPRAQIGAGAAILLAGGGLLLQRSHREKAAAATLFAFGPILVLMALFWRIAELEQGLLWGALALGAAMLNLIVLTMLRDRSGGFDAAPGAASALALGGSLSTAMTVAMATDGLWMSAGLAYQAPLLAWLWRRFHLPALKLAALAIAVASSARLLFLPEIATYDVGSLPILNALLPGYLAPALGFWLAARRFEGGGTARNSALVQSLEGAAIALFAAFVSLEIRHAMNAGDLGADFQSLLEASLHIASWALIAGALRWRFGAALSAVRLIAARALLVLAGLVGATACLGALNPWWGDGPDIPGAPVFNLLFIAYGLPAAAFAFAAIASRRADARIEGRAVALFAAVFSFAWIILTVRHAFHRPDLAQGAIGDAENWAYSVATISYATALLVGGAMRRSPLLRFAGLGALLLAVTKVFLVDVASLGGVWRATSFLGLGAALVGVAVLYQRVLAPMMGLKTKGEGGA